MTETNFQRNKSGQIIGLQHLSDPLEGSGHNMSALSVGKAYLKTVATLYGLNPQLIDAMDQPMLGEFQPTEQEQIKLVKAQPIRSFTVLTFQQTFRGLPIWEGGIVIRMQGQNHIVTGSACNVFQNLDLPAVKELPIDRQKKCDGLLQQLSKKARLTKFSVNASRDLIYRYEADRRIAPPEHGAPEHSKSEYLIPQLDIGEVPTSIRNSTFRYVREVLFTTYSKEIGDLNWRAFIDWQTNVVLYLRPLVADVDGSVFRNDPISLSGNPQADPTAPVALLDAQRELVTLERLILPGGGIPVGLSGNLVAVQDLDPPNIAPPTEPNGAAAVFHYPADSDNFAAVCAYYTHDWLYRLVETLGFDLNSYFDGASFPVPVDHRWLNIVNAQAPGNALGDGILRFRYSLADGGSTVGIACDPRVVAHEFGHGILWDHLSSPNFGFAHGLGDALAAILFDPESQAPDRFRTFPFNNVILRRHDRAVASGWGFGGSMDIGSYFSTQIVSSAIYRMYHSLGGGSTSLKERQHASRYTTYLMLQAVPLLSGIVPNTAIGFSSAMQESDQGTTDFEGFSGGWAHKVVRWGFEKQNLYNGTPPDIDIYIDDGRKGEYSYPSDVVTPPDVWNRHRPDGGTDHETPRSDMENYLYIRVGNRGSHSASGVKVQAYRATANNGKLWPDDWTDLGDAVLSAQPVLPNDSLIVGPIPWCPEEPCEERILVSASVKRDRSNISTISGTVPTHRLVNSDNNIALRRMEINCPHDDKRCEDSGKIYRYSVKFVCGCSKGNVVAAGKYFTAINVRNTSNEPIVFKKRFSVALPGEKPGNVTEQSSNKLGPYEALEIDCEDIARHNRVSECCFLKGFAVLESQIELDVVAVYTAAKSDGEVETIDVEEIQPRMVKEKRRIPPPPDDKIPPRERPKLPDLVPVKPFPPGPPFFPSNYCASPQEVRVMVRNQGEGPAGPSTTRVEYLDEGIIEERPTPALNPGDETTLSFPGALGCKGELCHIRITVNANPADGVMESNSTNNTDNSSCAFAS